WIAAMAPAPRRAWPITASMTAGSGNGRAPSCTSTIRHSAGSARRPASTESIRVAPPATARSRSPSRPASHSGGDAAASAGNTAITSATSGWERKGRSAWSSIGTPATGWNCLSTDPPIRSPRPAAATTTPTSRGKGAHQLVHVGDRHPGEPRRLRRLARRGEGAPEPEPAGLGEPALEPADRPDLAAEPDLAQVERVGGRRRVMQAREERRRHGEIRPGLAEPHPGGDLHEHVELGEARPAPPLQHREQ